MQNKLKKIGIITVALITLVPMSCFASILTNVENYTEDGKEYIKYLDYDVVDEDINYCKWRD